MTARPQRALGILLLGSTVFLAPGGCGKGPQAPGVGTVCVTQALVPTPPIEKVDVLFVIDDSPSMASKEQALASNLATFIRVLDSTGDDYHVGVVTSDVGAEPPSGSFATSGPLGEPGGNCASTDGDDGALQATPCTSRPATDFSSPGIQALCGSVCPVPIAPFARTMPDGTQVTGRFLASTGGATPTTNVPGNDVAAAFACMAFVGDTGCGIEMPLEAMKRALDGTNTVRNDLFLRKDALLAVVFVTDEDDCSSTGTNRLENDPTTMDCSPGGSFDPIWSCFNSDYRCFAEGTTCAEPLDQPGVKTGCHESTRPGNFLEPLSTYTRFLDELKPGAVLVDAIDSPPNGPVEIDGSDGPGTSGLNRSLTNAACEGPIDPVTGTAIAGMPQIRLHDFVGYFYGEEYSVCDPSDYARVLGPTAPPIIGPPRRFARCISAIAPGAASCVVADAEPTGVGRPYGACSSPCCAALAADPDGEMTDAPVQAACAAEARSPCWCAVANRVACPSRSLPTLLGVYRAPGTDPPTGTNAELECVDESCSG